MICRCKTPMVPLTGTNGVDPTFACRICDSAAQGGHRRVGPPNLPGTQNGWFTDPTGGSK